MLGELDRSGIGTPVECDTVHSLSDLKDGRVHSNEALWYQLREDSNAKELMRLAEEDWKLRRMSKPTLWEQCDTDKLLLCPRFGVEQDKPDGGKKVRAIDNFSWSTGEWSGKSEEGKKAPSKKMRMKKGSVNGHTAPSEKLGHDTLDALARIMTMFFKLVGEEPGLFKGDIDSAFRRLPQTPFLKSLGQLLPKGSKNGAI